MKAAVKLVLELVILERNLSLTEVSVLADIQSRNGDLKDSIIFTHVRMQSLEDLAWVSHGVETQRWGLVNKSRFHVLAWDNWELKDVTGQDKFIYPVYRKSSAISPKWVLNPELLRLLP